MPIHELSNNLNLPIKGIIRLGVRKESAKGSEYPDTVEYFVLKDAPEVADVYGEEPKYLDIMFPGPNIEAVLPTWYTYWTASVKQGNSVKRGELVCKGPGPLDDITPGKAVWYDRTRPPQEYAGGTPEDRVYPNRSIWRDCWGKHCIDAADARGNPKCKRTMRIHVVLPLISFGDIYVINTSSWDSMKCFHSLLARHQAIYGPEYICNAMYRIYREERRIPYTDKSGARRESKQFIMFLKEIDKERFNSENSDRLKQIGSKIQAGALARYLTAEEVEEASAALPMDELYPMIEAPVEKELTPFEKSKLLLEDTEFVEAMAALENILGTKFSEKARLKSIRDKEHLPNQKEAILRAIAEKIHSVAAEPKPVVEETTLNAEVVEEAMADLMNDSPAETEAKPEEA